MRRTRSFVGLAGAVAMIALFAAVATAQQGAQRLVVDADDNPLVIRGVLGAEEFKASLRISLKSSEDLPVSFQFTHLHSPDPDVRIDRSHVSISPATKALAPGANDFQVAVSNVEEASTYTGAIRISTTDAEDPETATVELTLEVRPDVDPQPSGGTKNLKLELINQCIGPVSCALADAISGAQRDEYALTFRNATRAAIVIEDIAVFAEDLENDNNQQLTERHLVGPTLPFDAGATEKVTIPLQFNRSEMEPGHYTGEMVVRVEGKKDAIELPLDISVREGPGLPLVLLVAGILAGRGLKRWEKNAQTTPRRRGRRAASDWWKEAKAFWKDKTTRRWKKFLTVLTGLGTAAPKLRRRLFIWAISLGLIVTTGFYNTYVEEGVTFGADPIRDRFLIFTWGLGAQVVAATASNLPKLTGDGP